MEQKTYEYKNREIAVDPAREFRFGDGKISGYSAVFLGAMSLLAVLAYSYPSYLTTIELRQVYDGEALRVVLKYGMYFSLFFGILTFVLGRYRKMGVAGITLTTIAFALGGYQVPVGPVEARRLSLGLDWLILSFLGSVFLFMTLEKIFPKYKEQVILRQSWGLDLFYFCFNHLAISAIILYGNYHAAHFDWAISPAVQQFIQSCPIVLQVIVIILCADFVLYWEHRLYHETRWLWPIHAVHHSVEDMDWLAGSRGHFIQVFSERAMVMIPLYLLGAEQSALNIYVVFAALQAVFIHCNLHIPLGPIKYIIVTPQFHHWHHSSEKPAIDTNYSAHTPLFDRLFGTYHMPAAYWPAHFGTTKKLPSSYWGQLLYPVTALLKK